MTQHTKVSRLVKLMRRQYVTPLQAALTCGLFSLSQRCGELERRHGYTLARKWVETATGSRVMSYKILRGPTA